MEFSRSGILKTLNTYSTPYRRNLPSFMPSRTHIAQTKRKKNLDMSTISQVDSSIAYLSHLGNLSIVRVIRSNFAPFSLGAPYAVRQGKEERDIFVSPSYKPSNTPITTNSLTTESGDIGLARASKERVNPLLGSHSWLDDLEGSLASQDPPRQPCPANCELSQGIGMDYGYVSSLSGSWLGELDGWMDEERERVTNHDGYPSVHRWKAAYGWTVTNMHSTYKQLVLVVSPGIGWTRPVSVDETLLQRCAAWQATPCMKSEVDEMRSYRGAANSQEQDRRRRKSIGISRGGPGTAVGSQSRCR
ncbi:hypothetical protein TRV_06241 [Trichophyton verrucosum HKI 0517]|uniref:Uncharacterized protein n=1 Tax=Trichophyton verrucosum (strain HKI 0517) TaxID=663202 RepID=D4DGD8_TRIVH|nr:uncharacterized protein TRV_06241 [Trichophyton verrucosum HKI 0517]EFE39103.1 hypothetical protein TRV_06241 [Trichophyton verrucosum HKI 0517]